MSGFVPKRVEWDGPEEEPRGRKRRRDDEGDGRPAKRRHDRESSPPYTGVDEEDTLLKQANKHIRQYPGKIRRVPLDSITRVLPADAQRKRYYQRVKEVRSTNHWGQRKLLLSEIEFLTVYGHLSDTVLYVGAAPGTHTEYLSSLFPDHKFVLVDPAPFVCRNIEGRIEIRNDFFTDEMAREFKGRGVLFISDIRTADPKVMEEEEVEETVESDQRMQLEWYLIVHPVKSMLKFRLPWGKGTTEYIDGEVYMPIFGRQSTTETRLVSPRDDNHDPAKWNQMKVWDHTQYEEQMFYFNTETRVQHYDHDVTGVPGLDHCFDCASEVYVLKQYLEKNAFRWVPQEDESWQEGEEVPHDLLMRKIAKMSNTIGEECSPHSGRDLTSIIGHKAKLGFKGRRYDIENKDIILMDDSVVKEKERQKADADGTNFTRRERGHRVLVKDQKATAQAGWNAGVEGFNRGESRDRMREELRRSVDYVQSKGSSVAAPPTPLSTNPRFADRLGGRDQRAAEPQPGRRNRSRSRERDP